MHDPLIRVGRPHQRGNQSAGFGGKRRANQRGCINEVSFYFGVTVGLHMSLCCTRLLPARRRHSTQKDSLVAPQVFARQTDGASAAMDGRPVYHVSIAKCGPKTHHNESPLPRNLISFASKNKDDWKCSLKREVSASSLACGGRGGGRGGGQGEGRVRVYSRVVSKS